MRFALVHKFATYCLALLGFAALTTGGELHGPSAALLAVGVVLSWFAEGPLLLSPRYHRGWQAALVLALLLQVARVALLGTSFLTAVVEYAALVQLSRLAERRSAQEYQQVTWMALVHLVGAAVLAGGIAYALCFAGFVIATPWSMTLGHLRREIEGNYLADARAGRAGVPIDVARILRSRRVVGPGLLAGSSLLALPTFLLTALVFVFFPRIGMGLLSLHGRGETTIAGFGSSVDLTGHGVIRDDPTIVLRIEPLAPEARPAPVRAFRLRGATFDQYTGRSWRRRPPANDLLQVERLGGVYALLRMPRPATDAGFRIVLDPLEPPVVPVPEGTVGLTIEPQLRNSGLPHWMELTIDRDDGLRYAATDDLGLVYTAWVGHEADRIAWQRPGAGPLERYLQLPSDLSPEVRRLAERLATGETTVTGRALAIQRHLATFRYTLRLESGRAERPVEDFLFRSHAGHCEYFSTAMAVLLRALGVPTRNVTGFLGGTYNRYGRFYAVRQGDAHSWVEVYDPARGWLTFDPTPPAGGAPVVHHGVLVEAGALIEAMRLRWREYVVGYDLSTQARLVLRLVRYLDRRRVEPAAPHGWRHGWSRVRDAVRRLPWRGGALVLLGLGVAGASLWFLLRARRRAAVRAALAPAVREAQELAQVLDLALAASGHPRPRSRSPLGHARDLVHRGDPLGPLAERVASRYMAARFGHEPLAPGELAILQGELRRAQSAVTASPG